MTFVEMVRDHGIEFIGPLPYQISMMGDKSTARSAQRGAAPAGPCRMLRIENSLAVPAAPAT